MVQRIRVPERAHPLVRFIYRQAIAQQITLKALSARAGLSDAAVGQWSWRTAPSVPNIEAVLNTLGYELTVRPMREDV